MKTKIKPEFEAKLRELRVYTKYTKELKRWCFINKVKLSRYISVLNKYGSFEVFIRGSFYWPDSDFWNKVARGINPKTKTND